MLDRLPTELLELIIIHHITSDPTPAWQLLLLSRRISLVATPHIFRSLTLSITRRNARNLLRLSESRLRTTVRSITLENTHGLGTAAAAAFPDVANREPRDYVIMLGLTATIVRAFERLRPRELRFGGGDMVRWGGMQGLGDFVPRVLAAMGKIASKGSGKPQDGQERGQLRELTLEDWVGSVQPRGVEDLNFLERKSMPDETAYRRALADLTTLTIRSLQLWEDLTPKLKLIQIAPRLKHLTVQQSTAWDWALTPLHLAGPAPAHAATRCLETLSLTGLHVYSSLLTTAFSGSAATLRTVSLTNIWLRSPRPGQALSVDEGWTAVFSALRTFTSLVRLKLHDLTACPVKGPWPVRYYLLPKILSSHHDGDAEVLVELLRAVNARRAEAGMPEYWYSPERKEISAEVRFGVLAGLDRQDVGEELMAAIERVNSSGF